MTLYFEDKTLCLSGNQDLTLYEGDSIFNAQPVKRPHFKSPLTCKHGDPIFLLHFSNVYIMNVNHAKFQKKFDSRTIIFQGNYLKVAQNSFRFPQTSFTNSFPNTVWSIVSV